MKKNSKHTAVQTGEWHVLDAKTQPLGRLATAAATFLMGKHLPGYTATQVADVHVVIINTDEIVLTGAKMDQKAYHHYSGYPGGLKTRTVREQIKRDSRVIVEAAISGMLPKNLLRDDRMRHLKLYKTAEHPHMPQTNTK